MFFLRVPLIFERLLQILLRSFGSHSSLKPTIGFNYDRFVLGSRNTPHAINLKFNNSKYSLNFDKNSQGSIFLSRNVESEVRALKTQILHEKKFKIPTLIYNWIRHPVRFFFSANHIDTNKNLSCNSYGIFHHIITTYRLPWCEILIIDQAFSIMQNLEFLVLSFMLHHSSS